MNDYVTRNELDHALVSVLAAPGTDTPVDTLCCRPAFNKRLYPERLRLTRTGGIEGDFGMSLPWLKHADGSPDPRIQVSILALRVLNLVWRDRGQMEYPGDTIIADLNTSLDSLPVGSLLQIGSAVLRVSDYWNKGCAKWRVRYGRVAYEWVSASEHEPLRLRGILCSIEHDGEIALGDRIVRL